MSIVSAPRSALSKSLWYPSTQLSNPGGCLAGRHARSTSARRHYATSPNSPSASSSKLAPSNNVDWPTYLALRRSRQIAGLATTVPTTLLSLFASGSYFLTLEVDPSHSLGGIDPVFLYAAATISCTGLGWLVGPTIGSLLWNLWHRNLAYGLSEKDRAFHEHIKRWRVNPEQSSMQNRLPDYYGEKVSSLAGYRRWLREQNAFRRKVAHGLDE